MPLTINTIYGANEGSKYTISYNALKSAVTNELSTTKSFLLMPSTGASLYLANGTTIDFTAYSGGVYLSSNGVFGVDGSGNFTKLTSTASIQWSATYTDFYGNFSNAFSVTESTFYTTSTHGSVFTVLAGSPATSGQSGTTTVSVNSVNDAPTLTTVSELTGGVEDTAYTITYAQLLAASNLSDVDSTGLSFQIFSVDSAKGTLTKGGVAVTPGTTLLSAGETLVWTPAANINGTVNGAFTVKGWDGSLASTTAIAVNVAVTAVSDAPTGANATFGVQEGTTKVFTAADFGFADAVDAASASGANALANVIITSLPTVGSLTLNGTAVTLNEVISVAAINASQLVYTPNVVQGVSASFGFKVQDDGGTANGGVDTSSVSANTITLNVNALPVVSGPLTSSTNEGDASYTLNLLEGASDANSDTLSVTDVTYTVGTPTGTAPTGVSLTGNTLTVDPTNGVFNSLAVNQAQTIVVNYTIADGNGGMVAQRQTVTINGTNDAPTTTGAATAVVGASWEYVYSAADFNFADVDAGDSLQSVSLTGVSIPAGATLTLNGSPVSGDFTVSRADVNAGNLVLTVTDHALAGTPNFTSFSYTVSDGALSSGTQTMTVNVVGDNTAPEAVNDSGSVTEDTTLSTLFNVLSNDTDVNPRDTKTVVGVSTPTGNVGTPQTTTYGSFVIEANGALTYTLNNALSAAQALGVGAYLTDTIRYTMADAAGATSTATVTITINGTNDAPALTGAYDRTVSGTEDVAYEILVSDLVAGQATDVDGPAMSIAIVGLAGAPENYAIRHADNNVVQLTDWMIAYNNEYTPHANGALLVLPTDTLIYTPTANANGVQGSTLVYRVWDMSDAQTYTIPVADTTTGNAFSYYTQRINLNLAPVPDATSAAVSTVGGNTVSTTTYLNVGDTASVTVTFDEAVTVTGTPRIALDIGGTTVYAAYASGSGSTSLVFTTPVVPSGLNGAASVGTVIDLNGGTILNATGNAAANYTISATSATDVVVDTSAPTVAIDSTMGTDTGATSTISSGGLTKDTTLALSGTYSDLNGVVSVRIYDGMTDLGLATLDNGTWTLTTGVLAQGAHSFTAVATDIAGNTNTSSALTATVDTTGPAFSSGTTANFAENATGTVYTAVATDTHGVTLSMSGTDADLFNFDANTGAVTFKVSPDYEAPSDAGGNNVYDITITATDAAGNATNQNLAITVTNVNEGPVATVPGTAYTTDEDMHKILTGISVVDIDAGNNNITVTLSVAHGTLTIDTGVSGGLTPSGIANNNSATVTLTGSVAAINATLADAAGLIYNPTSNYNGSDTLTAGVNDNGYTGIGTQLTTQETVSITIAAVNDPATIDGDAVGEVLVAASATDTGTLTVTDVDTGEAEFIAQTNQAATYGTYSITTAGNWTYVLGNNATVNKVPTGATITDKFTVSSKDGTDTQDVTVTITGAYAGVLTVAESEAVRGLTNFAINAATYDIDDSAENLAATTNTIISKSGIGTVTANTPANAAQAAAIAAFNKAVVYDVEDSASALATITGGLAEAASVTITGTTAAAADLNTIDAATSVVVDAAAVTTITGTASAIADAVNDQTTIDTAANVLATVIAGTAAAADLITIDSNTTTTVGATAVTTITGTASAIADAVNDQTTIDTAANVALTVNSGTATAAQANTIAGYTTGVVTATVDADTAANLNAALTATDNNDMLTLSASAGAAAASDLVALDGKTGVVVDATAVTTITGTASAIADAVNDQTTIDTAANVLATVNAGTAAAADLITIDSNTTTAVGATAVTTVTGIISDVTAAYTANTNGTITGLGNEAVTLDDVSLTAVALNDLNTKTTGLITATTANTITGSAADLLTLISNKGTSGDKVNIATNVNFVVTGTVNVNNLMQIDNETSGTLTYSISDTAENIMANPELAAGATTITITADPNAPVTVAFSGTETMTASQVAIMDTGISANDLASVAAVGSDVVLTHTNTNTLTVTGTTTLTGSELIFKDGSLVKLGGTGANTMYGSNIATTGDFLAGAGGSDVIRGLAGDDTIYGGDGNDIIYGGVGADHIYGGLGNDILYGGDSSANDGFVDTFWYDCAENEGSDLIIGFNAAEDKIGIMGAIGADDAAKFNSAVESIADSGSNVLITLTSGTKITLVGVADHTSVTAADFTFV